MRVKSFFVILAVLLVVWAGLLLFFAGKLPFTYLYIGEGLIVCILVYLVLFYRKIIKPLNTISNGMELLRGQDFSSRLRPVGQYEADRLVDIFNRMMEQLKNERLHVRERNHFLDLLVKASPMGVILTSLDGDVTDLNPMALKMLGVDFWDAVNKRVEDIHSPLAAELAAIPKGETLTVRLNDSNIYKCIHSTFLDRGFRHSFYLVESLTDEVRKAEKKAYEKVIRMIAHEINNTTAGITSTLDSVEQILAGEERMEDVCEVMRVCMERCFSMSRFITRFADVVKIPEPCFSPVHPNALVAACARFMEGFCDECRILLHTEMSEGVREVRLDSSLFEQVMVNIIKNAAESIGHDGEIWIRTLPPATIEVVDNGKGISREIETKLFTPFFSTKPDGQGIGLIFIREVLIKHSCSFSLRTYADGLTRFRISFP